ncbi:hypothetical protein [Paraburkholderia sp. A3RO-2L]|uniref:hypothetical protein n=1 Tax=Paraburkholderia sp. A3RO-2L TaxID=3028376 RepID=UPI003DA980BF
MKLLGSGLVALLGVFLLSMPVWPLMHWAEPRVVIEMAALCAFVFIVAWRSAEPMTNPAFYVGLLFGTVFLFEVAMPVSGDRMRWLFDCGFAWFNVGVGALFLRWAARRMWARR